jgi:hypothetical protein
MKQGILAMLCLTAGFLVGGLGPRAELRDAQAQLDEWKEQGCDEPGVGRGLAALFQGRPADFARPDSDFDPPDFEDPAEPSPEPEPAQVDPPDPLDPPPPEERAPDPLLSPDDLDELDAARTALDMRRTQARAALREQADLGDDEMLTVDAAVGTMNAELQELATDMIYLVKKHGEPTRLDLMVFAADTLEVMIETERSILDLLSDEALRQIEDAAVDPFSYIDPELIDLLWELDR